MSDLQLLSQLQELDLRVEAQSRALQEIEAALAETSDVIEARARVTSLQDSLHDQQKQLRDLEWDAEETSRQARQEEQKLYGGAIHNPKELDGLRRDLEQRQARRREIEDRELDLMTAMETTQAELARAQEELARLEQDAAAQHGELLGQQAEQREQVAALNADREKIAARVAPANLVQYEQLRRDKRGRALSKVERSTCQGCRIALPMGLVQRARAGRDFVFCPSCGRILVS